MPHSIEEIQQSAGNNKEALRYYLQGKSIVEQQKPRLEIKTYQRLLKGFEDRIKSIS